MIAIDDVLVSEDIVEKHLILTGCLQRACCWEGDYGAPMTQKEADEFEETKKRSCPLWMKREKNTF